MTSGIKKVPLQSEIIRFIQSYITEYDLKQGDKLPSQEKLIEMIGVSRTSLREAVKTLEAKGIVEVKNGKGIYIANHQSNALQLTLDFTEQKESLREFVEIRRILEREILSMVVYRATDEELRELGKIEKVLLDKYRRGENQTYEDRLFHYTIYELSHNKAMQKLITAVRDGIEQFWSSPLNMKEPFTDTIPLHEELYFALCERNVKKAQAINDKILDWIDEEIIKNV